MYVGGLNYYGSSGIPCTDSARIKLEEDGGMGPPVFTGGTSYGLKTMTSGLDSGADETLNFCCSSSIIKSKGLRNLSPVLPEVRTHSQKQTKMYNTCYQ
jgi:hypothetical protein